ncbi:hypothetical protein GTP44_05940 [Duganella sp. FT50W]|uniref:Lipoprotein n=1 Tax=Duganella lactea TaxID=2692173 RepID=A0A6L8MG49_9BURK|nr:hypothetical protein [Duganella lactea]MYM81494.1 hypothetical protein [Duganella lactea]
MKKTILIAAVLLAGCGNTPPVPDWQMNAKNGIDRATDAYMEGKANLEAAEYQRARAALSSTGKVDLIIRAELTRCAARVASLVFEDCAGYDKLAQDAAPTERAYAAYLAGRASAADIALLPPQHQAVAAATSDATAASAVQAIADPLARLVASGVMLRSGKASPPLLANAVDTASAQGWRRPLLAWLGVQAMRAEQAGDAAEAQRIRRRIALVTQ